MNVVEKLEFISDVEDSPFSQTLKEALIESINDDDKLVFDNVEDAIKYMKRVEVDSNGQKG